MRLSGIKVIDLAYKPYYSRESVITALRDDRKTKMLCHGLSSCNGRSDAFAAYLMNGRSSRVLPRSAYARFLVLSARSGAGREGHVWTAPRRQGVWLRLCERFGCGHVFGLLARVTNVPLALMLVRMALRPISKTRSLWRLPFSSGFQAVPLVHIASPSPSMRIALRRKLVPAELWFRPRPDGRRSCPLWSRAHRRSAPACWRALPRSA